MRGARKGVFAAALALSAAAVSGCEEGEPRSLDTLVEQGGRYLDPSDFDPYTGPVVTFFPGTADVELRARLGNGRFDGPYERYYRSGAVFGTGAYRAGSWHGPFESFYEDGSPWMSGRYRDGALDGPYRAWDETGALVEEGRYRAGARCGAWTEDGATVTYPPCDGEEGPG